MKDFEYFKNLAGSLSEVPEEGASYRQLLETAMGFSLKNCIVSTAEHVALFNLSHTLSFLLPFAATAHELDPKTRLIIFPGSLIPLDNSHQPRGLIIPELNRRINFFPVNQLAASPLLLEPAPVDNFLAELKKFRLDSLQTVFDTKKTYSNFAFQLADYMTNMYHNFFIDKHLPALTIHPLEDIALKVLIRLIEKNDPFTEALLFNRDGRRLIYQLLQGVFCAWGQNKGSFLFWQKMNNRVDRLIYNEQEDILESKTFRTNFEKGNILGLLRSRQLLPGVFLSLIATSYLPNISIAGGPKQLKYYGAMVRAANALNVLYRPESLSNLGYMDFRPEMIDPRIPSTGTGAYLLRNKIYLKDVVSCLKKIKTNVMV